MLWFVCFFNYADRQAINSVFPMLRQEFGFDEVQIGLIGSAFMWVYAAGAPLAGFIGDRVRRKDLILGGCIFWSLVTVMTGWCQRFWQFVAVRALEGFGETFYFPASMSLTSDYHDARTRSRALSFHQSSVYFGTIAGSWWGAWFAEHHGWRSGFYFFGTAGIVLAVVLYRFLCEPQRGEADTVGLNVSARNDKTTPERRSDDFQSGHDGLTHTAPLPLSEVARAVATQPVAVLLMLAFIAANFVATIFLTWTPTFLVEKFQFKLTSAGLSGSVFIHLASAASVPLGGLLADVLSRRIAGGRMLVQLAGLLVGSVFVFLVGTTHSVGMLLAAMAGFGFCKGLYDSNIFASLYDVMEPRVRATAAGLMNTVGWTGGALGPLYVGWATKYGHHASKADNMSEAIAWGGVAYLLGAFALAMAVVSVARKSRVARNPTSEQT